ncbi:MAG TPA: GIY-YIG nuclease family protein [Usitatibacter sp.]
MERQYYVYILTDKLYGTLYVGVTNDLQRRIWEHKHDLVDGFTREHRLHRLVWFEAHGDVIQAIAKEKRIKRWRRDWKVNLIQRMNPVWADLYEQICR